jgi:YEATS domain-containing protein 1/3
VKLVLGHSASWRKRPTSEGYTHDWTVLVRGEDGQDIRHFVEKVVFFLHESFPKPKRGEQVDKKNAFYSVDLVKE